MPPTATVFAVALALALAPWPDGLASAQANPEPAPAPKPDEARDFKLSGLMFGDYYYILSSHRDELEDENGFWLRRVYLAYDDALSKTYSLRVQLEANSAGDFASTDVLTVYLKDAWLKGDYGAYAVTMGLAPTPNIGFVERFQGYRSLEKTPLDLFQWDSSRDLGLLMQGAFGKERREHYSLQFGNGSGTGSETDAGKAIRAQFVHESPRGLTLEGYAVWQDGPGSMNTATLEAFAGWTAPKWRASLQYGHQQRRSVDSTGTDLSLEFLSAFAAVELSPRITVVGRVDGNFDPIPGGELIDYFPFSDQAQSLFAVVGLDFALEANVHVMPNVEIATYDKAANGSTPGTDLMPRVTLFFSW